MSKYRFVIDQPLVTGPLSITDPAMLHQWQSVLRLRDGQEITLSDGKGRFATATIQELWAKRAELTVGDLQQASLEAKRAVTLYCALLKRDNFEWVAQKATEVGVAAIVPIITDRTIKHDLKMDRLVRIAREAAEQSDRATLPTLSEPIPLQTALDESFANNDLTVACLFGGHEFTEIQAHLADSKSVGVFVGPEGGFSEAEAQVFKDGQVRALRLSNLTLRGETAAVIASYLLSQVTCG